MESIVEKTPIKNWSQIGMQEYLLVAYPSAEISQKIIEEKKNLAGKYLEKDIIKTQPHITIANFFARETMEETIIRYTQRVCSKQSAFSVEINNYSGLPPHTIFLRIQKPQPFKQLASGLTVVSNYINGCSCPRVNLISNPRLPIASHLPETMYLKAMMDYSQKTFHGIFMVNELVLLRRCHEYDPEKTINVFPLQPLATTLYY